MSMNPFDEIAVEHDHATVKPATLNTVTAGFACGGDVHVLVAGSNAAEPPPAAAKIAGVTKVIAADSHGLEADLFTAAPELTFTL